MREDRGNLWTYPADAVIITTNGVVKSDGSAVMGGGCAKEARDYFPGLDAKLGKLLQRVGNVPVCLGTWKSYQGGITTLFTFPTKHNWKATSSMDLIEASARELVRSVDIMSKFSDNPNYMKTMVLPRPGCGLGGLDWKDVGPMLHGILDDRFVCLTF